MQMPKNPLELYQIYCNVMGYSNPMQAFQRMFGNNPVFSRLNQMVDGKSEEEVKQIVFNLCKERGLNIEKGISILKGVGFKL